MANNPMQFLMQMMSSGSTPQQMVQNMMKQNPNFNAIVNQMQNSGMSPEQYVRQYAKQNNINIDQMINTIKNRGFKF